MRSIILNDTNNMTKVLVIAKDPAIANSLATQLPNELVTEAVSSSDEAKEKLLRASSI